MLNRFMFILGLVLSLTVTLSVFKFAQTIPERLYATKIALPIPPLAQKSFVAATYTQEDLKCLQENIFFEARNQSPEGQTLVGIVTLERVRSGGYPHSICEVVHQHAQFSWTLKRHHVNMKNKIEAYAWWMSGLIAQNVLVNANSIDNVYNNLVYYHKSTVHPKWADSSTLRREFVVDDHVFYSKVNKNETLSLVLR